MGFPGERGPEKGRALGDRNHRWPGWSGKKHGEQDAGPPPELYLPGYGSHVPGRGPAGAEGRDRPEDEPALERLCANLEISFQETGEGQRLICQGEEVTERIREPEIGWMASVVSMMRPVREAMGALQRKMGSRGGVVAEGRDMGTVVFPGARFKFFLVADPRERSLRRYRELKAKGREIKLEEVEREVRERDAQDSSRELAPLRPAEDAHLIDSTGLNPEEVVARMLAIIQKN